MKRHYNFLTFLLRHFCGHCILVFLQAHHPAVLCPIFSHPDTFFFPQRDLAFPCGRSILFIFLSLNGHQRGGHVYVHMDTVHCSLRGEGHAYLRRKGE